jgi:uncharacterized protein (DUF433 family)
MSAEDTPTVLDAMAGGQNPAARRKVYGQVGGTYHRRSRQCGGRPCIRGMRIRVTDVLDLLANGLTAVQVLEELPDLEPEDIQACLRFASQRLNHPVVVA